MKCGLCKYFVNDCELCMSTRLKKLNTNFSMASFTKKNGECTLHLGFDKYIFGTVNNNWNTSITLWVNIVSVKHEYVTNLTSRALFGSYLHLIFFLMDSQVRTNRIMWTNTLKNTNHYALITVSIIVRYNSRKYTLDHIDWDVVHTITLFCLLTEFSVKSKFLAKNTFFPGLSLGKMS